MYGIDVTVEGPRFDWAVVFGVFGVLFRRGECHRFWLCVPNMNLAGREWKLCDACGGCQTDLSTADNWSPEPWVLTFDVELAGSSG